MKQNNYIRCFWLGLSCLLADGLLRNYFITTVQSVTEELTLEDNPGMADNTIVVNNNEQVAIEDLQLDYTMSTSANTIIDEPITDQQTNAKTSAVNTVIAKDDIEEEPQGALAAIESSDVSSNYELELIPVLADELLPALADTAEASTDLTGVSSFAGFGLSALTTHFTTQFVPVAAPMLELTAITLWGYYPNSKNFAVDQHFTTMLSKIKAFNAEVTSNHFKVDEVVAYVSSPNTVAAKKGDKYYDTFNVDDFIGNVVTRFHSDIYSDNIQLNILVDDSSFKKGQYKSSEALEFPTVTITGSDYSAIAAEWTTPAPAGGEAPIKSALSWFYDLQHELSKQTAIPSEYYNNISLVIDPETPSSQGASAHIQEQALMMYINEFRHSNPIGNEVFKTAVSLGVDQEHQAYGLVTDYPIALNSIDPEISKGPSQSPSTKKFIQDYNQEITASVTLPHYGNTFITYDGFQEEYQLGTSKGSELTGSITDKVYLQVYQDNFIQWQPNFKSNENEDGLALNSAFRDQPYYAVDLSKIELDAAPPDQEYDYFNLETNNVKHLGGILSTAEGGQIAFNLMAKNEPYTPFDYGPKAINDVDDSFSDHVRVSITKSTLPKEQEYKQAVITEIANKYTYPPLLSKDDSQKIELMFSMEGGALHADHKFLGDPEKDISPLHFAEFIENFEVYSNTLENSFYTYYNGAAIVPVAQSIPVTNAGAIDNIAIYDYGVLMDSGIWGFQ